MGKALFNTFTFIFMISFIPAISKEKDNFYVYWYGFGIGAFGNICGLQQEGILTNEEVSFYKIGMLEEFSKNPQNFNQKAFYDAELFIKDTYPDCEI